MNIEQAIQTLNSFIEYAEKTKRFDDAGKFKSIRDLIGSNEEEIEELHYELIDANSRCD